MKIKFFELARQISKTSTHHSHFIGSVIVNKNKILGMGTNHLKTHTKSPHLYKSIHSEFNAVMNCNKRDLCGADIYVYRETKNGTKANAFCCQSCYGMLKSLGIRRIFYTYDDGFRSHKIG